MRLGSRRLHPPTPAAAETAAFPGHPPTPMHPSDGFPAETAASADYTRPGPAATTSPTQPLARQDGPFARGMAAFPGQPPGRILVIKLRYVGDVLLCTPVLTCLREGFPKAHLAVLVNAGTEAVLLDHPAVDELLLAERSSLAIGWRLFRKLRRRFDLVVDLTDGDRSAIISRLSGAPIRLGYNSEGRWRGRLYTQIIEADRFGTHTVRYHWAAVEALGFKGSPPAPAMVVCQEARAAAEHLLRAAGIDNTRPIVCLHPGARWWFKSWPAERFAALADRIQQETAAQALFLGSALERGVVERIALAMRTPHRNVVGRTDLQQLAAVVKQAVLMVSNDNGPMHIAAAVGVPVVGLFGPSDPRIWGPWGEGHRTFYKGLDCRRCFHPDCFRGEQNCMRLILLDEVWQEVRKRLRGDS
jgi:predicted lipopolysaccharide heptosyltransferase III